MKKISLSIYIFFFILIFYPFMNPAWGTKVHQIISWNASINFSKLSESQFFIKLNLDKGILNHYLNKYDKNLKAIEWITYGSEIEDDYESIFKGRRSDNHFHNPLKLLNEAGLNDIGIGESLIFWAQDGFNQQNYVQGNQSWGKVRENYYNALISPLETTRNEYFANMLKGIGHQIHLIQDASVPDHVRNDAHLLNLVEEKTVDILKLKGFNFRCIEGWAENNLNFINDLSIKPLSPLLSLKQILKNPNTDEELVPITELVDAEKYTQNNQIPSAGIDQGLAEYACANFVSEDTIFTENFSQADAHYFPFPKISSTNYQSPLPSNVLIEQVQAKDGKIDKIIYISKDKDGEKINHFLTFNYFKYCFTKIPESIDIRKLVYLDNLCHKDYASMLVPRAVGYSAKLIDYFFRGEIEITLPEEGIYSFSTQQENMFNKITLKARNITPDGEQMINGDVSLVVRYRQCKGDPFQINYPKPDEEQKFIVVKYPDQISISQTNPIKLEFDLSSNPLPTNAVDINLTLVFKGTLGAEKENAVAIGFKDISEPTPIDLFNNTDRVCFNGTSLAWNDPSVINAADKNGNGEIECGLENPDINIIPNIIRLVSVTFNGEPSKTDINYHRFPDNAPVLIQPGEAYRLYVLADRTGFNFSALVHSPNIETPLTKNTMCRHIFSNDPGFFGNRDYYLNWNGSYYDFLYSKMGEFRGDIHYNLIYYNNTNIPEDTSCGYVSGASAISLKFKNLKAKVAGPAIRIMKPIAQEARERESKKK